MQNFFCFSPAYFKNFKLTTALNFRYDQTSSKFFSLWKNVTKHSRSKKTKLKKLYNNYIRKYGQNTQTSYSNMSFLNNSEYYFLSYFTKSLQLDLPKTRSPYLMIFLKWRSLSGHRLLSSLQKSTEKHLEFLKLKVLKNWKKLVVYSKSRRKTLRSAIIFHRTFLKKRVLEHWRPKKQQKRRK